MYKVQDDRYWQSSKRFGRKVVTTHHGIVDPTRPTPCSAYGIAAGTNLTETDAIITELYDKEGLGTVRIAKRLLSEHNIGKPVAPDTAVTGEPMVMNPEVPLDKNVIQRRLEALGVWRGDRRKKHVVEDKNEVVGLLKARVDDLEFALSREREERAILKGLRAECVAENVRLRAVLDSH